jgi:alpha-1,2-mannosyltransferase
MTTPFVHGHDLCVLAIAVAFLVKDGLTRGFLPGDRLIMLFSWIVIFLCFRDFSSGWIPCLVLLALAARRVPKRSSTEFRRP